MQSFPALCALLPVRATNAGASLKTEGGGATTTPPSPAPLPHDPVGYPALIQSCKMATSEAEGSAPGGMGDEAFCILATESCASFFVGSSFDVAFKSP